MTDHSGPEPSLNRRRLFRGGAVLAGAAGATALGAGVSPVAAEAANGDPVKLGTANQATTTTTISAATGSKPALVLANPDGPALSIPPASNSWDGTLSVGEIANTVEGPVIGADFGEGTQTVFLATSHDFENLPTTFTVKPVRILDTRTKTRPPSIIATSDSALDSQQRLKAGAWMDVEIAPAGDGLVYSSVFANVAVLSPTENGYLVVYPPGDRPGTSTVNYQSDRSTSNGLFMSVEQVEQSYALRIWTSGATHVVLDLTAVVVAVDNTRSATSRTQGNHRARRRTQAEVLAKVNATLARNAI